MKVCTDACLFGAWVRETLRTTPTPVTRALDIGTGTGLLSLMLAQNSDMYIDAIELDPDAAQQAKQNFALSPWQQRLSVTAGDIRLLAPNPVYELIVSNPPFFAGDLKSPDSRRNTALHSEHLSLPELFRAAVTQLSATGSLALLLPYHRREECLALAANAGLHATQMADVRQTEKHPFFRSLIWLARNAAPLVTESFSIRDGAAYSVRFTQLLKDYYLYL